MKKFFAAIFAATIFLTGCNQNPQANSETVTETFDDNPTARVFVGTQVRCAT